MSTQEHSKHWIIVLGWLSLGGAERQALEVCKHLKKNNQRVTVIGLSTPGVVQNICAELNIPCELWNLWLDRKNPIQRLYTYLRFTYRLKKLKPTHLLPYTMYPNILCGTAMKISGAKSCVWQQRDEGRFRIPSIAEKISIKSCTGFCSNSYHAKEWMAQKLSIKPNLINVINNGIMTPKKSNTTSWQQAHGLAPNKVIVSMVANLHIYKDHATLLKAWQIVLQRFTAPPLLVLAGEHCDAYPKLRTLLKKLDIEQHVQTPGAIRDISQLLYSSTLFAFSSNNEGCPNAVLEAMAHGLPIAATDIPAIREAIGKKTRNLLNKPKDHISLASNIIKILELKQEDRKRIGTKNKERISRHYTIKQMVNKTVSLHRNHTFNNQPWLNL